MKIVLLILTYFQFLGNALTFECQNNNPEENTFDFCEINGYNRNDLPPYPPLEVNCALGDDYGPVVSVVFM